MPERQRRAPRLLSLALYILGLIALPGVASARRNGIAAPSCSGCHGSQAVTALGASTTPATFDPGDDVVVTVTLTREGSKVGGIYIAEPAVGQLRALDRDLELVTGGLVHSTPKTASSGGQVSFRFGWRAPTDPGAVRFEVAALSGDGDGRPTGDATLLDVVSFTYGCSPRTFFGDLDGDGFGSRILSPIVDCEGATPASYSSRDDDCDDTHEKVFPGAVEVCNDRDDDCDDSVDEGAPPVELWPDEDGDGYYATPTGTSVVGCVPLRGYAADPGDCAPRDGTRNPGATEICNLFDDNCNGRIDERLRPQCGVGFCRRESETCDIEDCRPGTPSPERCNLLDDDCNGFADDGVICAAGETCVNGKCLSDGTGTGGTAGVSGSSGVGAISGRSGVPTVSGAAGVLSGGRASGTGSAAGPAPSGCNLGPPRGSWLAASFALVGVVSWWRRRRDQRGMSGGIGT